jgi:hypothetical protein
VLAHRRTELLLHVECDGPKDAPHGCHAVLVLVEERDGGNCGVSRQNKNNTALQSFSTIDMASRFLKTDLIFST